MEEINNITFRTDLHQVDEDFQITSDTTDINIPNPINPDEEDLVDEDEQESQSQRVHPTLGQGLQGSQSRPAQGQGLQGFQAPSVNVPQNIQNVVVQQQSTAHSIISPRVGGIFKGIVWTGGSNIKSLQLSTPQSIKALCPQDFKSQLKVEELCTEGLAPKLRLDLETKKGSTVTLTSWVSHVREYMEYRGLDTVFRVFNHKNNKEHYLLEK